ncbi:MAG: membrane protein insertase YidC [Candidatus Eutrophobiaceae bacterium]
METRRFILLVTLGLVGMMLWQQWQFDYGAASSPQQREGVQPFAKSESSPLPPHQIPEKEEAEDIPNPEVSSELVESASQESQKWIKPQRLKVSTDVLGAYIDLKGGSISELTLLNYPIIKDKPDQQVRLLYRDAAAQDFYIAQSGIASHQAAPTHITEFRSKQASYELGDEDSVNVDLLWEKEGYHFVRRLVFHRGSYLVDVIYKVENRSETDWIGQVYGQLQRTEGQKEGSKFIYTYTGAAFSTPDERYEKIDFDEMLETPLKARSANAWVAMIQHYYVTAVLPSDPATEWRWYTNTAKSTDSYIIGGSSPPVRIVPGESAELRHSLYLGPKIQEDLDATADHLELTVDYGFLWFIAHFLFWLLEFLHGLTGNWGFSIILLTLAIKVVFYRLSAAGYRSMAIMRKAQPKMLEIRERFRGDRQRMNQEMMTFYKREKINPLGGCFPLLIQIPVFIALYWVLLESVEMRQAEFILWINDLSSPDRYFVLPIIMGITMHIQHKLNPPAMDPMQEKIMSFLPIVFTIFFAFFPSGLVLYWVANNVLSIIQQWLITRSIEKEGR